MLDNEPLHKRGWTLQERYLSRRMLHYTKYQMFWECKEGVFTERGEKSPRTCCLESVTYGDPDIGPPWYQDWLKLVEKYSGRKLTVGNDRLPALSGMASRLADAMGDQYCAGIWQSRILHGISWRRKWFVSSSNSEGILPAPSWSWASINAPVQFYPRGIEKRSKPYVAHTTVLSIDIEPEGENLYGAVRSGRLTMRGPLLKVEATMDSMHFFYWDRYDERKYPCYVLPLWTQGRGEPLDSDCQARGLVGLIVKPTSTDHTEFRRVSLVAPPRPGETCKVMYYKAADVRDLTLV